VEEGLPLLRPKVAVLVAQHELDGREEIRLSGPISTHCETQNSHVRKPGKGREFRAELTDDVVPGVEGFHDGLLAVAFEALDDHLRRRRVKNGRLLGVEKGEAGAVGEERAAVRPEKGRGRTCLMYMAEGGGFRPDFHASGRFSARISPRPKFTNTPSTTSCRCSAGGFFSPELPRTFQARGTQHFFESFEND